MGVIPECFAEDVAWVVVGLSCNANGFEELISGGAGLGGTLELTLGNVVVEFALNFVFYSGWDGRHGRGLLCRWR